MAEIRFEIASPTRPVLIVPVRVNGSGPYEFALDTGASMTVLSAALAKELGIAGGGTREGFGAGGAIAVSMARLASLAVSSEEQTDLNIAITDLSALAQAAGTQLDGILGYNYLKNFRITIDYPKQVIRIERPESP